MITLSIIIVNYNTSTMCVACVNSLRRQNTSVKYEIVIVDNASSAEEVEKLRKIPRVRLLLLSQNVGYGKANNIGITKTESRFVLLLNPDTLFIHDSLSVLVNYMALHPEVGACGATLLNASYQKIHAYSRYFPSPLVELDTFFRHWPSRMIGIQHFEINESGLPIDVAYITGADIMLRRKALEQVGMFDADFFMYYEETELCARLRCKGWRITHIPTAQIIHLEGKSQRDGLSRYKRIVESRKIYMRKMGYRMYNNFYYLICMFLAVIGLLLTVKFKESIWMSRKIAVFVSVNFR